MSVIATLIEPERVTRIFFDYTRGESNWVDEVRIAQAIARTYATGAVVRPRRAAAQRLRNGSCPPAARGLTIGYAR